MIFDEKTFAENMNKNGFQKRMCRYELSIYAKWLKYLDKKPSQIKSDLKEFCEKYNPSYNEVIHANLIKSALSETKKNKLRIPIDTYITQKELDIIDSLPDIKFKKVLFIILVVGKYFKLNNVKILSKKEIEELEKNKDNKVEFYYNSDIKEAIKLAKVKMSKQDRINMEYSLVQGEYLENTALETLKIPFVDLDGESVITISNYDNLILYYDNYVGEKDIINCDNCGNIVEKNNGKHKYCNKCAKEINRKKSRERIKNKRLNT